MELSAIRKFCLQLPGVTEDIKWQDHLCFSVGKKMFLLTSPDRVPVNASFKVSENDFQELVTLPDIVPAPYLARYSWVMVAHLEALDRKQWQHYLREAHRLVAARLKRSERELLGISPDQ